MHCLLLYNVQAFNTAINIEMLSKCKVRISELHLFTKQGCFKGGR